MYVYGKCPGCGLPMGLRKEPPGVYACRRCKRPIEHVRADKGAKQSVFRLIPNRGPDPRLMTIPRV